MRQGLAICCLAIIFMAARPVSELQLWTQMDGQPQRWTMPDGGKSGIFTTFDGGSLNLQSCIPLGGTLGGVSFAPNVLLFTPLTPANLCIRPQVNANGVVTYWDGGCTTAPGDENFGVPVAPLVPQYVVPHSNATHICAATDAGALAVPIFSMQ